VQDVGAGGLDEGGHEAEVGTHRWVHRLQLQPEWIERDGKWQTIWVVARSRGGRWRPFLWWEGERKGSPVGKSELC